MSLPTVPTGRHPWGSLPERILGSLQHLWDGGLPRPTSGVQEGRAQGGAAWEERAVRGHWHTRVGPELGQGLGGQAETQQN